MTTVTPFNRKQLLTAIRLERRAVEAERVDLVHEIRERQDRIDEIDDRLRQMDQSESLLTDT